MRYGDTDLLCYRADGPDDLVARQNAAWQPLLDWAETALGARLAVTSGILAIDQPTTALAALRAALDRADIWRLTAIQAAAAASGSLILALALAEGRIDGPALFALAQIDETYQMELWGETEEAKPRRDALAADIDAAARLLTLLSADRPADR
jgi:chaperone required for assembly of F1-ATPase